MARAADSASGGAAQRGRVGSGAADASGIGGSAPVAPADADAFSCDPCGVPAARVVAGVPAGGSTAADNGQTAGYGNAVGHSATVGQGHCLHCGTPVAEGDFCGQGCAYAYRMVHAHNWEKFYHIRNRMIAPVGESAFSEDSYDWLASEVARAEAEETREGCRIALSVQGASCAACAWLIEKVYGEYCRSGRIDIDLHTARLTLRWEKGVLDAEGFARALQGFGYTVGPADAMGVEGLGASHSRRMLRKIGLCAAFQMNVMLYTLPIYFGMEADFAFAPLFYAMAMVFATLSLWVGGSYFIRRAWESLRRREVSLDLPLSLGIVGSYAGSMIGWVMGREDYLYFDFVSTFILLMLLGRWAKEVTLERNRKRLNALQPVSTSVRVVVAGDVATGSSAGVAAGSSAGGVAAAGSAGGGAVGHADVGQRGADGSQRTRTVSREQLRRGQRFVVGRGERVAVESVLHGESASFDLAWINGEPQPRVFEPGQPVPAGARYIGLSEVELTAREDWEHSLLARLFRPVEHVSHRSRVIRNVIRGYLIGIIVTAFIAGIAWTIAADVWQAGAVVTAVLVVSCPCALGLAFPLADELAVVALRRLGLFVRADDLWERLCRVRRIVFDKTGTLTLETPVLQNPQAVAALNAGHAAALFALVRDNPHPVARSLYRELLVQGRAESGGSAAAGRGDPSESSHPSAQVQGAGLPFPSVLSSAASTQIPELPSGLPEEVVGKGVRLGSWSLGRADWAAPAVAVAMPVSASSDAAVGTGAEPSASSSAAPTVLACDGVAVAHFYFTESIRSDALAEVGALRRAGYRCEILSGDSQPKVDAMARALGMDAASARGGLSPEEKACAIEAGGGAEDALMIGDGANDSLAFDSALCRGTPVVYRGILEQKSDFYYMGQGIGCIRSLFEVSRTRTRTHAVLLIFMIAYNISTVGAAVAGWIDPLIAAVLMPASSLFTLLIVAVMMRGLWRTPSARQS